MAAMVHYYTQKGRMPSEIFNAPEGEKAFLFASMLLELEKKGADQY
ncbi:MAG: hypothetical protein ACPLQO_00050 [Desulfotomaculales bacterium]